jgi:hypothetical protein
MKAEYAPVRPGFPEMPVNTYFSDIGTKYAKGGVSTAFLEKNRKNYHLYLNLLLVLYRIYIRTTIGYHEAKQDHFY